MRIGLDVSAALAGDSGIKFYVEELLAGLSRAGTGHEFVLYAAFWKNPSRLEGVRLPQAPNFELRFKRVPQRLLLPLEEWLPLGLQERWFRGWGLELFHGLGNLLPPLERLPSVVTVHHSGGTLDRTDPWALFYFNTLAERSIRRADAVIAVSEFSKREAVRLYDLKDSKTAAIHEGGPSPVFKPADGEPPAWLPAGHYILYVGAILERKNLAALVAAFARLKPEFPAHRLVLAGGKGRYYPKLAATIHEAGLESEVVFLEGMDKSKLAALYRHAAVFAYPSLLEGFGFPVLEAMACGTPVVASFSGAIPEVAGDAAILVDARDAGVLAGALRRVLSEPGLTAELRTRGFERVRRFSWDKAAEGTLAVYGRLLRGGS